jgi:transcriptional/translational regulatory protein YebC/TACO1
MISLFSTSSSSATSPSSARLTPVAFLFEHKAQVRMQAAEGSDATFDSYFEAALDGGAEDVREVETEDGIVWEVS